MLPEFITPQRDRQSRRLLRGDRFIQKLTYVPFWRLGQEMPSFMGLTRILLLGPTHMFIAMHNIPFLVYR